MRNEWLHELERALCIVTEDHQIRIRQMLLRVAQEQIVRVKRQ